MNYITGSTIKTLREKKGLTQKELGDEIGVSDKTISKWETEKGLPDVSILGDLAESLGVSLTELFTGEMIINANQSGNMKKLNFYVCPVCGNIITALGEGSYSCCGILLPKLEVEELEGEKDIHNMNIEDMDGEIYVTLNHEMTKEHYISFIAHVKFDGIQLTKLYPEQMAEARFTKKGHGIVYAYCNRHGLYKRII